MGEYLDDEHVFLKLDDGSIHCMEEKALELLLKDDVIFCNSRDFLEEDGKTKGGHTTVLFVNCNDVFSWGTSDAEDLPYEEIGRLYKMHKADPHWGSNIWCILRRKQKPQKPMEDMMRKDGVWTDELEKVEENTQDAEVHAMLEHDLRMERDKKRIGE